MTRDVRRPEKGPQTEAGLDAELLAGLWEDAPLARLPSDAPPELKDMVQIIENPKRVYAIHRASRRHNFQILVETYVQQLRYNITSARTLAVYLASQDNPETGLCPYLNPPKETPAALSSLIFSSNPAPPAFSDPFSKRSGTSGDSRRRKSGSGARANGENGSSLRAAQGTEEIGRRATISSTHERSHFDAATGTAHPPFKVAERPVNKDYRSFAANVFGTVAFKMLEWLTPAGLDAMSQKVAALEAEATQSPSKEEPQMFRNPSGLSTPMQSTPPMTQAERKDPGELSQSTTDQGPDAVFAQGSQTLHNSILNVEVVDLVCDILQDDGTSESHLLDPPRITSTYTTLKDRASRMQRKQSSRATYPKKLRRQWKLFIEQSLFNILSDPVSLVASFVKDDELLDSHTICLWMAAGSLFKAPKSLQSLRSPATRVFRRTDRSLANVEAGQLLSICLHALVAAAPLITDSRILFDMSRIRSNGLTLAGSGALARQPAWLCLLYEDAFSNDLALRLARRLFAAISARRCFADMAAQDDDLEDNKEDFDALRPLLSQLDLLNSYSSSTPGVGQLERAGHESRVSTLLLDWAKTVMLQQWDGQPEISYDSSFGGALSLIAAMYEKRQDLLLGDTQFRVDYFAERLDSINMPVAWLTHTSSRQKKHLLDFPFIFEPSALVSYFRSINFSKMSRSYEESSSLQTRMKAIVAPGGLITNPHHKLVLQDLLKTASSKYLILEISRKNVIRDAFDQLWRREARELHRPLKIHLGEEGGEEGFDSGGVQQEFFRLAVAECLNPDHGAFTVDDRTRMTWFVPGSVVPAWKFEILGLLVSLAVYNGLTLPITFPKALYRKLLGEPVDELHHIADGWPDLAMGLTTLLEWDEKQGLVEDVFARTYEFSVSMFGQPISREMDGKASSWPQFEATAKTSLVDGNPEDAPLVTNENRNVYVSDYIKYLTDVSVAPQYEAFERGFRACLHPKALGLLTPPLLQSLVEGVQEIDISELRRYTRYVGWDATHRGVRDFWSIVKRYDEKMKRRLLEFVTASDRVPVGGMKNMQFVVQRNGEEEGEGGHLPTAYTCYGTLLLPEYKDKDVLRERLSMALENAQGFGFA
ncbi:hypothetical protein COL5a_010643 [Colletotrichum fioriniae]|nr:uncharacterized protein COL516b_008042 [Colletotrichum fioriniae]KAJ0300869.1 hypothetical protein COL516b_008042 [Colletotrichum fioriniae]KAJ0318411.1 hypothetical protein COL5a_010643 [Colletotrichum fioriniae]